MNARNKKTLSLIACAAFACLTSVSPAGDNWPRFRGADGTGMPGDDAQLPDKWSLAENVAWSADVPGVGWSSPVVWGDKVFLTTVVNEKAAENAEPRAGLYLGRGRREVPSGTHHWWVYCFDLKSGNILWKHEVHHGAPPVGRHPKSCYAAETPVTDGKHVYFLFGDVGLFCYDFEGKQKWKHPIEPKKTMADYGAAASPVLHDDQVIYVYDNQEASYIMSLDAETGKQRWRKPREEKSTWATPFVWTNKVRTEIVVPGKKAILSYDLKGDVLWRLEGRMSNLVIPSPFVAGGLLYVTSGYFGDKHRPCYAIKPGATGDITLANGEKSNQFIQWYQPKAGPYNTTPAVYRGVYYLVHDQGMLSAYDARSGEPIYDRVRFPQGASFTSSPWAYNGKLFCLAENGTTYVLEAGKEFKILHTNKLEGMCMATPAIVNGRILIRTLNKLFCIAKAK